MPWKERLGEKGDWEKKYHRGKIRREEREKGGIGVIPDVKDIKKKKTNGEI